MSLEDTLETYGHFVKKADEMGLAYIILVRYAAKLDATFDGKASFPQLSTQTLIFIGQAKPGRPSTMSSVPMAPSSRTPSVS